MFSGGEAPWEDDARSDGWWGDESPFRVPVFVLTHPLLLAGGVRLFDRLGADPPALELTRVVESPSVTHLRDRVVKGAAT